MQFNLPLLAVLGWMGGSVAAVAEGPAPAAAAEDGDARVAAAAAVAVMHWGPPRPRREEPGGGMKAGT